MVDTKPKYHSDTWLENDDVTVDGKRVKNYGYEAATLTWRPVAVNSDGELITGVNLVQQSEEYYFEGDAILSEVIKDGKFFKNDVKVTKIGIFARTAPTGADLKLDLLSGGVALSKVATLTAGQQYEETDISDNTYLTTDRFGLTFTQIGSTLPGTGISITVFYEKV